MNLILVKYLILNAVLLLDWNVQEILKTLVKKNQDVRYIIEFLITGTVSILFTKPMLFKENYKKINFNID